MDNLNSIISTFDITKLNIKDLAFLLKIIEDIKPQTAEDLEVI